MRPFDIFTISRFIPLAEIETARLNVIARNRDEMRDMVLEDVRKMGVVGRREHLIETEDHFHDHVRISVTWNRNHAAHMEREKQP